MHSKLKCSRCRCWKLEKEFINVHEYFILLTLIPSSRIMRTCNSCRRRNKPHASLSKMKKEQEEMLRQLPTVGLRAVSHLRIRLLWTNCHRLPLVLCHARRVMEGWKAIPLFLVPADRSCRGRLPFPFQGPWATFWTLDRWSFIPWTHWSPRLWRGRRWRTLTFTPSPCLHNTNPIPLSVLWWDIPSLRCTLFLRRPPSRVSPP